MALDNLSSSFEGEGLAIQWSMEEAAVERPPPARLLLVLPSTAVRSRLKLKPLLMRLASFAAGTNRVENDGVKLPLPGRELLSSIPLIFYSKLQDYMVISQSRMSTWFSVPRSLAPTFSPAPVNSVCSRLPSPEHLLSLNLPNCPPVGC